MEKSYYTPSIEEFHIGFEYEYKSDSYGFLDKTNGEWKKEKFSAGGNDVDGDEIYNIEKLIHENNLRVKCLDREDIESFGWEFIPTKGPYDVYHLNKWSLIFAHKRVWHEQDCIEIKIEDDYFFRGFVKNKSELTRLMKQLNIKL